MELENKGYGIYELNKQLQEWEIEHQGIIALRDEIEKLEEAWKNEQKWLEDQKERIEELKWQIKENNKDLTTKLQIEQTGIDNLRKETDLAKKVKTYLKSEDTKELEHEEYRLGIANSKLFGLSSSKFGVANPKTDFLY